MGKIKTGTMYGYRVDAIKVETDGTTHAPETIDFAEARTLKELAKACVAEATTNDLAQVLPIMPTACRIARKWAVDFEDIRKCPSFRYITDAEEIPDTSDIDDEEVTE